MLERKLRVKFNRNGGLKMVGEMQIECKISNVHEIIVNWNGYSFLTIYGYHINGWFIAIPNWGVCVEASDPDDVYYNSNKLAKTLDMANASVKVAKEIKKHWEGLKK